MALGGNIKCLCLYLKKLQQRHSLESSVVGELLLGGAVGSLENTLTRLVVLFFLQSCEDWRQRVETLQQEASTLYHNYSFLNDC